MGQLRATGVAALLFKRPTLLYHFPTLSHIVPEPQRQLALEELLTAQTG